jgi:hypothetical protein
MKNHKKILAAQPTKKAAGDRIARGLKETGVNNYFSWSMVFQRWPGTAGKESSPIRSTPSIYQTEFSPVDRLRQRISGDPSLL